MQLKRYGIAAVLSLVTIAGWGLVHEGVQAAPPDQTGIQIRYGETISGEINEKVPCHHYWFVGAAGDRVTVDMVRTSGSLDGTLALYLRADLDAEPIAFNDDRPGQINPLITATLPVTDWYTIAACRLQAETMRVTVGTFDLTLTGSDASTAANPATATASPLSEGMFGGENGADTSPPPGEPEAAATAGDVDSVVTLTPGVDVAGQLDSEHPQALYVLSVQPGDRFTVDWSAADEVLDIRLSATDPAGSLSVEAAAPVPVSDLRLAFEVPTAGTVRIAVSSLTGLPAGRAIVYTLSITRDSGANAIATPTPPTAAPTGPGLVLPTGLPPAPSDDAAPAGEAAEESPPGSYLSDPCASGADAVDSPASDARLANVHTAAGDSFYAENTTETDIFRADDDLNLVFTLREYTEPVNAAALFCAPDGSWFDSGETKLNNEGPHLLGMDWEWSGIPWEAGEWFVELYLDDALASTIQFTVEEGTSAETSFDLTNTLSRSPNTSRGK
jgi:hypothetical protein